MTRPTETSAAKRPAPLATRVRKLSARRPAGHLIYGGSPLTANPSADNACVPMARPPDRNQARNQMAPPSPVMAGVGMSWHPSR